MTMAASLKDTWGQPLLFLRGCTNLIKNLGENNMPRCFQHLTKVATLAAPAFLCLTYRLCISRPLYNLQEYFRFFFAKKITS